jgi:hypothetical protein
LLRLLCRLLRLLRLLLHQAAAVRVELAPQAVAPHAAVELTRYDLDQLLPRSSRAPVVPISRE